MKNIRLNRSEVMNLAWALQQKNPDLSRAAAEMAASKVLRLYHALQQGSVRFTFQKQNGEIRQAVGTLRPDLFVKPPKSIEQPEYLTVLRYYDMEKDAIRSFRAERILQVAA